MENEEYLEVLENEGVYEVLEESDISGESATYNSIPDMDNISDNITREDLANALRDLMDTYSSSSEASSSDLGEEVGESEDIASESTSQIDYTEILNDLFDSVSDSASKDSNYYEYVKEIENNNRLDSNINDISLNNLLTILLIAVIMFLSVVTIGRRGD